MRGDMLGGVNREVCQTDADGLFTDSVQGSARKMYQSTLPCSA